MLSGILWDLKKAATYGCYTDIDRKKFIQQTLSKMEPIGKHMTKHKKYLLGEDLCYLDFYLFELLSLINFTTFGELYTQYPYLSEYKHRIS